MAGSMPASDFVVVLDSDGMSDEEVDVSNVSHLSDSSPHCDDAARRRMNVVCLDDSHRSSPQPSKSQQSSSNPASRQDDAASDASKTETGICAVDHCVEKAKDYREEAKRLRVEAKTREMEAKRICREQERLERQRVQEDTRASKARAKEARKLIEGKNALDHVRILVDHNVSDSLEPALMEELVETFGERVVRVHQAVRGTITWERSTFSADGVGGCTRSVKTAPQIVILMSPARLEELVESDSFGDEVARARMRFPEPRPLCLLIWGLKSHLQGRPVAAQRVVLNEISDALQGALVARRVGNRNVESVDEACATLSRITRAVAEETYASDVSVSELHRDTGVSAGGKSQLSPMAAFLCATPGVGEEAARAVAREFPCLRALSERYGDPMTALKEKKLLLQARSSQPWAVRLRSDTHSMTASD